jgi:hypothetical protein
MLSNASKRETRNGTGSLGSTKRVRANAVQERKKMRLSQSCQIARKPQRRRLISRNALPRIGDSQSGTGSSKNSIGRGLMTTFGGVVQLRKNKRRTTMMRTLMMESTRKKTLTMESMRKKTLTMESMRKRSKVKEKLMYSMARLTMETTKKVN